MSLVVKINNGTNQWLLCESFCDHIQLKKDCKKCYAEWITDINSQFKSGSCKYYIGHIIDTNLLGAGGSHGFVFPALKQYY